MATGAILAGGRAIRFGGRDKSALLVEGRAIIDRQISELSRIVDEILVVGAHAPVDRPSRDVTVRSVADRIPGLGPLGGVYTALEEAHHDVVLILACDMPFVTTAFLGYLLSLADEADAVVPSDARGIHPLSAVYSSRCRTAIERRLARNELALTGLLNELKVRRVDAAELGRFGDPDRLLANINTPADYAGVEPKG